VCSAESQNPKTQSHVRVIGIERGIFELELELELIQTQLTQRPMLRAEVGMRVRCANKASAECIMRWKSIGIFSQPNQGYGLLQVNEPNF